jgi:hypothetical protein
MGEQQVPYALAVVVAVWAGGAALLLALARSAAAGSALQSRLFRQWLARPGAGPEPVGADARVAPAADQPADAGRRRSITGSSATS